MNQTKIKKEINPWGTNVLLEELPAITQIGIIIVPEAYQQKLNQGKVVDKGPMCSDRVVLGDIVFYPMHSEHRLGLKNPNPDAAKREMTFILVPEEQILGCIKTTETKV